MCRTTPHTARPSPIRRWSVFTNFSVIDARYVNSKESAFNNKKVEFVPPVIFRSGISFRKNKVTAIYQYSYTARQFGDATDATTPSNDGINGPVREPRAGS